ncbi:M15 family metallopeptidase [Plantactinospora sp. GCM10030261]|uniref:M15 family metallopeptidase n=1 Tax=Plantactinospora sp. GCM10030261 TaxID=3273420 RepID=UPI00361B5E7D
MTRLRMAAAVLALTAVAGCGGPSRPPPGPSASPEPRAPAGFVALDEVDPTIRQEIRYHGADNFVGRPIAGYREPLCLLTRPAADALRRARSLARADGRGLRVYDCYRPRRAVDDFVAWGRDLTDQRTKPAYYPRVDKAALFDEGYLGAPSAHSRGSTVDITLDDGAGPVDMGTPFDRFDPLSHTTAAGVSAPALTNRLLLRRYLTSVGFVNYDREWWHYRLADEPFPATYFDFPVARSALPEK